MLKPETVDRAIHEIEKGYAQYQYFFDRLNSHFWLAPLQERGFFRQPSAPVREGQYISFPLWPESRYLTQMASIPDAQKTVMDITLAVPDTENVRVHEDLLDVALALPPEMAARFVPQAKKWVRSPYKLLLPEKIGDLIVHLAVGGQGEAALDLAGAALALQPDPRTAEKEDEDFFSAEPQPLFDKWDYQRILEKAVRALSQAQGIEAVQLFADLLNSAIEISRKKKNTEAGGEDYLYI